MGLDRARPPQRPDGRRERLSLPREPASVPQSRAFVRRVLASWGRDRYEEAGTLLVSELVSNAILHARSDVEVELAEVDDQVVLAVRDESPSLPVVRRHTREAGTGRGLWLLDHYSSQHGVDVSVRGPGKQVWAVLCPETAQSDEGADAALVMWLDSVDGL